MSTGSGGERFTHFLLTRFNVQVDFGDDRRMSEEWLERRFALFERFTLPSVLGQSARSFLWYVLFDEGTPAAYRCRAERLSAGGAFTPLYLARDWEERTLDAVRGRIDPEHELVVTSRLDNDDAIGARYIELLQAAVAEAPAALVFPRGLAWEEGRLYLRDYPANPFVTLVERREDFRGVFRTPHDRISDIAPVRHLCEAPMWLQVIHDQNIANRVGGLRFPRNAAFPPEFRLSGPGPTTPEEFLAWLLDFTSSLRHADQLFAPTRRRIARLLRRFG